MACSTRKWSENKEEECELDKTILGDEPIAFFFSPQFDVNDLSMGLFLSRLLMDIQLKESCQLDFL